MSDDYLKIIPVEQDHVPPSDTHASAVATLEQLCPEGEECEAEVFAHVEFIDQGENLEAIICPRCSSRTPVDFFAEENPGVSLWSNINDQLEEGQVTKVNAKMPCCGAEVPFTSLSFDWPAGFARFQLSVRNPSIGENLTDIQLAKLEEILGCKLKQVRAHY